MDLCGVPASGRVQRGGGAASVGAEHAPGKVGLAYYPPIRADGRITTMFQGLGCKVEILTPEQREKKGMSITEARSNKRAILKAPVVFPRPKTGPVRR